MRPTTTVPGHSLSTPETASRIFAVKKMRARMQQSQSACSTPHATRRMPPTTINAWEVPSHGVAVVTGPRGVAVVTVQSLQVCEATIRHAPKMSHSAIISMLMPMMRTYAATRSTAKYKKTHRIENSSP